MVTISRFACDFTIFRFEHCYREANKVAYELARLVVSPTCDWFEEHVDDIVPILIKDVTIILNE